MGDEIFDELLDGDGSEAQTTSLGERFKAIREERGLALEDIAKETRIPIRHLETLERGDYANLPGRTYAIGFAKAYARFIDEDEVAAGEEVRNQYEYVDRGPLTDYQAFQPTDPSRLPSRFLAWTAAIVGVLLLGTYLVWKQDPFGSGDIDQAVATSQDEAAPGFSDGETPVAGGATATTVSATDPVIIAATNTVWIRVDDAEGNRIYEREMQTGESYTVPAGRNDLVMTTARPQDLTVTVGGRPVATLGPPDTLISDVPLGPQKLVERANAGP